MVNNQLNAVFGALADPTRRQILEQLARGECTVGELAARFTITQPAISKHVRILEEAGLLQREIDGRFHRCTIVPDRIDAASAWIEKQRVFWTATLDRLDTYLKHAKRKGRK